jgi:lactobin A/cerein 7B family class IIb bacteriocin
MQELRADELKNIDGGFQLGLTGLAIGSIGIPFIIGIISGYFETVPCK